MSRDRPEAPVPAPQTPHLLPSSLFPPENHAVSCPLPPSSYTSARHARRHLLLKTLGPGSPLEGATRLSRHAPAPHRPRARPSTQRFLRLSGMWPTRSAPRPRRHPILEAPRSRRFLDLAPCEPSESRLPRAWRPAGPRPLGVPGSRFTIAFERHAIDVLLDTDVLGGARLLHVSWDEAWNIMERAVARGYAGEERRVMTTGVDEKAVADDTATSRWCATWTDPPWSTSPPTASRPA